MIETVIFQLVFSELGSNQTISFTTSLELRWHSKRKYGPNIILECHCHPQWDHTNLYKVEQYQAKCASTRNCRPHHHKDERECSLKHACSCSSSHCNAQPKAMQETSHDLPPTPYICDHHYNPHVPTHGALTEETKIKQYSSTGLFPPSTSFLNIPDWAWTDETDVFLFSLAKATTESTGPLRWWRLICI